MKAGNLIECPRLYGSSVEHALSHLYGDLGRPATGSIYLWAKGGLLLSQLSRFLSKNYQVFPQRSEEGNEVVDTVDGVLLYKPGSRKITELLNRGGKGIGIARKKTKRDDDTCVFIRGVNSKGNYEVSSASQEIADVLSFLEVSKGHEALSWEPERLDGVLIVEKK